MLTSHIFLGFLLQQSGNDVKKEQIIGWRPVKVRAETEAGIGAMVVALQSAGKDFNYMSKTL